MLKQVIFTLAAAAVIPIYSGAQSRAVPVSTQFTFAEGDQATTAAVVPQALPATPTPQAQPRQPEPAGQPVNISIELTIAEAGGGGPIKKTVSMIVADRQSGFVRTKGTVRIAPNRTREISINVDARPTIMREGTIRLDLGLEYQPKLGGDSPESASPQMPMMPMSPLPTEPASSNLNERISVMLESGKALVISQAADPGSDRQINVTVKATILK